VLFVARRCALDLQSGLCNIGRVVVVAIVCPSAGRQDEEELEEFLSRVNAFNEGYHEHDINRIPCGSDAQPLYCDAVSQARMWH
jgi:hypothetical protein